VLVYITHTRLEAVLRRAGHRAVTLKSDTVSAERREEWLARRHSAASLTALSFRAIL